MRYAAFATQDPRADAAADGDWRERLDRLRFDFGKWDLDVRGKPTVARGALVLSAAEHREAVAAAEAIDSLAGRARARLAREPAQAQALGVDARLAAVLPDEAPGPMVTRIDLFRTPGGWQVAELNDDCPGGYNEALGLPVVLDGLAPEGTGVPGDLPQALLRLARLQATDGPVALLYATGYAEDLQVVELLAQLFQAEGLATVQASPAHVGLRGGLAHVLGAPAGRLFRFFPTEWLPGLPNWATWAALPRAGVPLCNPLATATTQSKAIHAWLWEHASGSDRGLVERLFPRTRILDESARAVALDAAARSVIKPAFGRMGEGVVLGRESPPEWWRKRVGSAARAHRSRPYVLQDRFDSVPVEVEPGRTVVACLGAYVVDGRFAGYYSRLSPDPVVDYGATNVLTVVEGL